jgi:hypothetical protein
LQAPESRLFTLRSEFQASVLELLSRSRHSLALADHDFGDWPLESPEAFAELSRLLKEPDGRLRLVVHSPDWLDRHATRFAILRRTFGARIDCRRAPATLPPGEGLLVGDRIHLLRRAHYQAFRGRLQLAMPESVEPWLRKYEQLWQESAPCLTGTTTGLAG